MKPEVRCLNDLFCGPQAAVFGAGCWAEQSSVAGGCRVRVACSVSGQGELIVQSLLAKTLVERIAGRSTADSDSHDTHDILRSVLVDEFYGASPFFFFFCFSPRILSLGGDLPRACHGAHGSGSGSFPWGLGKWHQRGEHQPAVGVLLITQGVDGDEGTGL
jgi:hypothetical protein